MKNIILITGLILLTVSFSSCPIGDDHKDVGKRCTIIFDTGDVNPRTGQRTSDTIPPTTSIFAITGDLIDRLPEPYWLEDGVRQDFNGWYTSPDDETGARISIPYKVSGDTTLYAWWGRDEVIFDATDNDKYPEARIIISTEEGDYPFKTYTRYVRRPPWEFNSIPYPVNSDNAFQGWWYQDISEKELTLATSITSIPKISILGQLQRRVYAKYGTGPADYTITFNAAGGKWGSDLSISETITSPNMKTLSEANKWPIAPAFRDFPMLGWFTPEGVLFNEDSFVTRTMTVTARWLYSAVEQITYQLDGSDQMIGTMDDGSQVIVPLNNTTPATVRGHRVLSIPSGREIDFGQLAGSYLAENQWTLELFIRLGSGASNYQAIRAHTDDGNGQNGTLWLERRGLIICRPDQGRVNVRDGQLDSNTWYHIAIVKNGSTVTSFVNGTQDSSGTVQALTNAAFNRITYFYIRPDGGHLYRMILHNSAKTASDFSGVMTIVNALNGV